MPPTVYEDSVRPTTISGSPAEAVCAGDCGGGGCSAVTGTAAVRAVPSAESSISRSSSASIERRKGLLLFRRRGVCPAYAEPPTSRRVMFFGLTILGASHECSRRWGDRDIEDGRLASSIQGKNLRRCHKRNRPRPGCPTRT